jgi:PD-(D/E)XK nuclease superfamily protein
MMIDNSQANAFRTCPLLWYEQYAAQGTGLELKPRIGEVAPMDLGSRVHELLEEYYTAMKFGAIEDHGYPPSPNEALENEAQIIFSAYRAKYPVEEFEIVDVERTFKVELPRFCKLCYTCLPYGADYCVNGECLAPCFFRPHIYTGKIDLTFRQDKLNIMDHKTENRRGQRNMPKKWAARDQATLYLWAASRIYPLEEIGQFYVNILKRPSEKLQEGPLFPDRQRLERTPEQLEIAVRDIVFIADEIERYKATFKDGLWPANREACSSGWSECDFYMPHTYGWSEEMRKQKYQAKSEYLKLGGVDIIQ